MSLAKKKVIVSVVVVVVVVVVCLCTYHLFPLRAKSAVDISRIINFLAFLCCRFRR